MENILKRIFSSDFKNWAPGEGYTLFHYRTFCFLNNLSKCQFGLTFVN
jgi:hypothetical protein